MSTNNTSEGNRIIAEFMGVEYYILRTAIHPEGYPHVMSKGHAGYEPLQYHTSWDWLMPACKKWNDLVASKQKEPGWTKWQFQRVMLDTDINKLFNRLVEKINWYNSQQNDPNGKV